MEDTDKAKRARRQTNFFTSIPEHNSKKNLKRISIDVGDVSENLRPILRTKSTSTISAKKIVKKYSKSREHRSVTHSERCQIQVVTPLPGWKEDLLRMAEDSDQEKRAYKSAVDLFTRVTITPESLERLAIITCKDDGSENAKIQFNARIKHDDSKDATPVARQIQKQKKDIISKSSRPAATQIPENDIIKSLNSLHDPNRREKIPKLKPANLSSWILSSGPELDSSLERENAVFGIAAASVSESYMSKAVSGPVQPRRKSKRKSFCDIGSEKVLKSKSDNVERECHITRRRSSVKPNTSIDCAVMRKLINRKTPKLSKKRGGTEPDKQKETSSTEFKEKREFAAEKNVTKSKNSEGNIASSPEILIVSEKVVAAGAKRKRPVEDINAKRVPFNSFIDEDTIIRKIRFPAQLDWTPLSRWHVLDPICIIDDSEQNGKAHIETSFFSHKPQQLLESATFPIDDNSPLAESISTRQITDAEKDNFLSRLEASEKEWINIFNQFDPALPWSEAFSPKKLSQWIGNPAVSYTAGLFLRKWKKRTAKEGTLNVSPVKNTGNIKSGDTSDADSDFEEDEIIKSNPLILCGPNGSGKSALISALASELDMNIVEVHPGEKRGAVALKQKLDGTLKNHALQHKNNSIAKFLGMPKGVNSCRNNLIVIEHVDIYFREDSDFWSTLKNLVEESRVPIIFTCESLPLAELQREPSLDSYELLQIDRCELMQLAKYIRCCLWITKNLDASLEDLAIYIKSFKCDLKKILLDLQLQTAVQPFELYLSERTDRCIMPLVNDKETTHYDQQAFTNDKKIQYSYIYSYIQITPHSAPEHIILRKTAEALRDRLPRFQLALDYLPYLVEMDKVENKKKREKRRRWLHYFHEVRDDRRVDSNDTLLSILYEFKMIYDN